MINRIKTYLRSPINLITIFLLILTILASISRFKVVGEFMDAITKWSILLVVILLIQGFFNIIYDRKYISLKNTFISILIVILTLDPLNDIKIFILAGIALGLFKNLIRFRQRPVLNLSAISLLSVYLFLLVGVMPLISWWGVSFAPRITSLNISIASVITLTFAGFIAYRLKKLSIVFSFLASFTLVFLLLNMNLENLLTNYIYVLFDGTLLFFALVMLIEPKTSPVRFHESVSYGLIAGLLVGLFLKFVYDVDPYVLGLCAINLIYGLYLYLYTKLQFKSKFFKRF